MILGIHHFVNCIQTEWKECGSYTPPATVVFLIFLLFEALLFTIFTAVMLTTQLQGITNDETVISFSGFHPITLYVIWNGKRFPQLNSSWVSSFQGIEQLKKEEARWRKKSKWKSLQSVFGRFSIGWLSPFTQPRTSNRSISTVYFPVWWYSFRINILVLLTLIFTYADQTKE